MENGLFGFGIFYVVLSYVDRLSLFERGERTSFDKSNNGMSKLGQFILQF
jgi:hypothetical protein